MRTLKPVPCLSCASIGVTAKGLCKSCYNKSYKQTPEGKASTIQAQSKYLLRRKNEKSKTRKQKYYLKTISDFNIISSMVKSGCTIENACKKHGISKGKLYRNINTEQKIQLKIFKLLNAKTACQLNDIGVNMSPIN